MLHVLLAASVALTQMSAKGHRQTIELQVQISSTDQTQLAVLEAQLQMHFAMRMLLAVLVCQSL